VSLHAAALPEVPIIGDRLYLSQLMSNLVENAVIHTSRHGTRVCVEVGRCHAGAAAHGWVRVADDGPGIAPEHLPHLFDRFYRVDRARTRDDPTGDGSQPGGSGLGLSIARWIAQAHGGEVTVQSTLGRGATFEVRLPLD
jgi:signal transduction histidine kinase